MFVARRFFSSSTTKEILDVSFRDGIQDKKTLIPLSQKINGITQLLIAGLRNLEVAAFVGPKVPQMNNPEQICQQMPVWKNHFPNAKFGVLIPNLKGYQRCIPYLNCGVYPGIDEVALVTSASDTFNVKNLGRPFYEQISDFGPIVNDCKKRKIFTRIYLSNSRYCPFEGQLPIATVVNRAVHLYQHFAPDAIVWADTTGENTPEEVELLIQTAQKKGIPIENQEFHGHNPHKRGVANSAAALKAGIKVVHGAAGGVGGCPSFPGNDKGNTPTEDLVLHFRELKYPINIDFSKIQEVGIDLKRYK